MSDFTTMEVVAKRDCKSVPGAIEVVPPAGNLPLSTTTIKPAAKRTRTAPS